MKIQKCPACNHKQHLYKGLAVFECLRCGALFGTPYLGDSYTFVLPYWDRTIHNAKQDRYFDFECLGSEGIQRRHGWFNPASKCIVQVG